jgi:hypothetical protein
LADCDYSFSNRKYFWIAADQNQLYKSKSIGSSRPIAASHPPFSNVSTLTHSRHSLYQKKPVPSALSFELADCSNNLKLLKQTTYMAAIDLFLDPSQNEGLAKTWASRV